MRAEDRACAFLTNQDYQILERNLRLKNWEVDIIAWDKRYDEYVFVEVKWRKNEQFGEGSQAVDGRKLRSIGRVAKVWLNKQQFAKAYRFDIISLVGKLDEKFRQQLIISHFKNVTW